MSIPVVSIARLMPFHEATIVYFCLAVSGNRLSVGGGPQASRLGTLLPLEPPPLLLANFVSSQPMVSTLLLLHLLLLLVCLFFLFVLGCLCLLFFPPFFFCRYNRLVSPRRRRLHFLNPWIPSQTTFLVVTSLPLALLACFRMKRIQGPRVTLFPRSKASPSSLIKAPHFRTRCCTLAVIGNNTLHTHTFAVAVGAIHQAVSNDDLTENKQPPQ